MDYDIPTELAYPENLICVALDSGHAGKTVLKILDDFGFAIVPKEPTEKMLYAARHNSEVVSLTDEENDEVWQAMLAAAPSVNG